MKDGNPFTLGYPVPPDFFVGRINHLNSIDQSIAEASTNSQRYLFATGERGIGKTSFARFACEIAYKNYDFLPVNVIASSANSVEELTRLNFEEILKETSENKVLDKIRSLFGEYIKEVGVMGINLSFNPPPDKLNDITRNFPEAIKTVYSEIKESNKGIFIILDDLNGICKIPSFALWLKGIVDYIATHYSDLPLLMMIIGISEIRKELSNHQPSILRIFEVIEIEKLSDSEVEDFFQNSFRKQNITLEKEALEIIVEYSSGLPNIMQEIGSAIYRIVDENIKKVTKIEAFAGVTTSAEIIGKKYLDPKVYESLRSERYISILRKMGGSKFTMPFKKSEVEKELNAEEKKVFHNFLLKMKELNVIIPLPEKGRGYYRYANQLYPVYIFMESYRHEHGK